MGLLVERAVGNRVDEAEWLGRPGTGLETNSVVVVSVAVAPRIRRLMPEVPLSDLKAHDLPCSSVSGDMVRDGTRGRSVSFSGDGRRMGGDSVLPGGQYWPAPVVPLEGCCAWTPPAAGAGECAVETCVLPGTIGPRRSGRGAGVLGERGARNMGVFGAKFGLELV